MKVHISVQMGGGHNAEHVGKSTKLKVVQTTLYDFLWKNQTNKEFGGEHK